MKKLMIVSIVIILIFAFCGCENIIESMDRNSINYDGATYSIISQQWSMNDPDEYNTDSITNNNSTIRIRTYNYDLNRDFIYVENDSLLYHNNTSKLPRNNVQDIDYLSLRFHDKTLEIELDDEQFVNEFISILSKKKYSNVSINKNIASLIIYYKNYPACYFYGNIIMDKEENICIDLSDDSDDYVKLDVNSKILKIINSNIS